MIINDMIQEEKYYENEWKEINSTVRHGSSGHGHPGRMRQPGQRGKPRTLYPATTAETATEASAASGETKDQAAAEAENAPSADLSGAISMVGSTSMEKFANALSESFMEKYPNVTVTAEFVGSGAGCQQWNG